MIEKRDQYRLDLKEVERDIRSISKKTKYYYTLLNKKDMLEKRIALFDNKIKYGRSIPY